RVSGDCRQLLPELSRRSGGVAPSGNPLCPGQGRAQWPGRVAVLSESGGIRAEPYGSKQQQKESEQKPPAEWMALWAAGGIARLGGLCDGNAQAPHASRNRAEHLGRAPSL